MTTAISKALPRISQIIKNTESTEFLVIYLFGVLCHFPDCTGHITTSSWKGKGNQCIQLVKALYCKLPTNGKQDLNSPRGGR